MLYWRRLLKVCEINININRIVIYQSSFRAPPKTFEEKLIVLARVS